MAVLLSVDGHAGGGPCRVVHAGVPPLRGGDARERSAHFRRELDWIRTALMHEPRGHAGEFGAVLGPPVRETSTYSLIFFDPAGYLEGCGHGTLCSVAVWQRMMGKLRTPFEIDNPDGTVTRVLAAEGDGERCRATLELPAARVLADGIELPWGEGIGAALVRCGNPYVVVEVEELGKRGPEAFTGIESRRRVLGELLRSAQEVVEGEGLAIPEVLVYRPRDGTGALETSVLFNATQIDRSPCGTGSGALASLLLSRGEIEAGKPIATYGPRGLGFEARVEPTAVWDEG
ncbi:MAG TPA: proline racemase family protein [Longimicrobiales bacterium]|nr:proline racemase family protein [Longimicrobiales bacterium]